MFKSIEDPEAFLYFLASGTISEYVQKYLNQIIKNVSVDFAPYKDSVDSLLSYIEKTEAVIIRAGDINPIDKCATVFRNAITFVQLFVDRLVIHDKPTATYSEYEDNVLCKLLRLYKCQRINLSNSIMTGGHYDHADLRKSSFVGADMSGKVDISFASLMNADFTEVNMQNIDMYRADADNSIFYSTNLRESRLEEASFKKSKFINTDLSGANLKRANLTKAVLRDVTLDNKTSFKGAEVTGLQTNKDLSDWIDGFEELVDNGTIVFQE